MTENKSELTEEELNQILNEKVGNLTALEQIGKDSHYITELSEAALIQLQLKKYEESISISSGSRSSTNVKCYISPVLIHGS